jgi:hypothetical protein
MPSTWTVPFAGDGDRLLQVPEAQVGVDRRDAAAGHLDGFALRRRESGERERDRVRARRQIDDPVLAATVADDGPRLLDEHRAGGFDGRAGKDGARRILDDPCKSCLRKGSRYEQQLCRNDKRHPYQCTH